MIEDVNRLVHTCLNLYKNKIVRMNFIYAIRQPLLKYFHDPLTQQSAELPIIVFSAIIIYQIILHLVTYELNL